MAIKEVYRQGRTEFDGRAYSDVAIHKEIKFSSAVANVVRIPVEKGRWVVGVRARTKVAFTGGTPTVTVGDSDDVDGYIEVNDIDTTTLNSCVDSRQLAQDAGSSTWNAYAKGGRYYSAPNQIIVTFAAGATAGVLILEIIIDGYSEPTADMIT